MSISYILWSVAFVLPWLVVMVGLAAGTADLWYAAFSGPPCPVCMRVIRGLRDPCRCTRSEGVAA